MLSVGIDAHQGLYVICAKDEHGKTVEEKTIRDTPSAVANYLRGLGTPVRVCYEASLLYGTLHDTLRPFVEEIQVAHPGRARLIFTSKRKNDRIDAEKLATLLFMGQVPVVHVPKADVRNWRGMIEHRRRTVQKRTAAKSAVRALLRSLALPSRKSLWSKKGMKALKEMELPSPLLRLRLTQLVEEIEHLNAGILAATKELDKIGRAHAGVQLLQTIPGIGPRTSEAFVAYVDTPQRFQNARRASSYFGLVPILDQSAGTKRQGHISKDGPPCVRQYLVEAAWQAVRRSPTLKAMFDRIRNGQKNRRGIALVAVARHLSEAMLAMLKRNEPWREMLQTPPTLTAAQPAPDRARRAA